MPCQLNRWIRSLAVAGMVLGFTGLVRADTYTWNGAAGSDWFEGGNWTPAGPPPAGADVVYNNAGAGLLLTNETPVLASFTMTDGTLTCTNWFTRIQAGNVTIEAGTVTLPGPFTEADMSNRVWIVASGDFTLGSNAVIDVAARGYLQQNGEGAGIQVSPRATGAGHGGQGGMSSDGKKAGGIIYGRVDAPMAPGSGGGYGGGTSPDAGPGGGVVRIEVGGTATVDGTIAAEGGNSTWRRAGGGSGGSIHLSCSTFAGSANGLLSANGGDCNGGEGGSGGGGRIAVEYTTLGSTPGVRFSAAPGGQGWGLTNPIHWHRVASMGTLWLSDTGLLSSDLSNGQINQVRLVIGSEDTWSVPQLVVTHVVIAFAGSNFQVNVAGDLAIGASGRLQIGDRHGDFGGRLTCGGNLTVADGGELWIFGGATNGVVPYGASVTAAGDVTIGAGSWLYPVTHPVNGGGARLRMRRLTISEQGGIDAHARGFGEAVTSAGPGKGGRGARGSGGGHGGKGGRSSDSDTGGVSYGTYRSPLLAGSSGGAGTSFFPGKGGGLVWIEASGGVNLQGTITADGAVGGVGRDGGGAGGGILLACEGRFVVGENSVLTANGANAGNAEGGGGGGGRIAVYHSMPVEKQAQLLDGQEVGLAETGDCDAIGTLSVVQGWGWADATSSTNPDDYAKPGTIVFVEGPPAGTIIMIQ